MNRCFDSAVPDTFHCSAAFPQPNRVAGAKWRTAAQWSRTAEFQLIAGQGNNGRKSGTSGNNKTAIEEDDIGSYNPVKKAPLSAPPTVVATTNISNSCSSPPQVPSKQQVIPAEKDILILDKDFDDKIKSISSFVLSILSARVFCLFSLFYFILIQTHHSI